MFTVNCTVNTKTRTHTNSIRPRTAVHSSTSLLFLCKTRCSNSSFLKTHRFGKPQKSLNTNRRSFRARSTLQNLRRESTLCIYILNLHRRKKVFDSFCSGCVLSSVWFYSAATAGTIRLCTERKILNLQIKPLKLVKNKLWIRGERKFVAFLTSFS